MWVAYKIFLASDYFHMCVTALIIFTLKILDNRHTREYSFTSLDKPRVIGGPYLRMFLIFVV